MSRRVFVFGARGMLGGMVSNYFLKDGEHLLIPLSRKEFDVLKTPIVDLENRYSFTKGDVLVNAIGLTNRELSHLSEETFYKVNRDFPKTLDRIAGETGAHLLHISTDCVFDGKEGGYSEESAPNAKDLYGLSKAEGEALEHAVIFRTSLVGIEVEHFRNLLSWVLAQEGKTIRGYTNHTWNGITTLECAEAVKRFIKSGFPAPGLYHVTSGNVVTKYELIVEMAKAFDVRLTLTPYETEEPVFRHLTSRKALNNELGFPPVGEGLRRMRGYCDTNAFIWKST